MNRKLKRYYRRIRWALPCSRKLTGKIIAEIRVSVQAYLEENPGAVFEDVERLFGTPQQIAAAYLDEMDRSQLARELRLKSRVAKTFSVAVAAALLMLGVTLSALYIEIYASNHGYLEITYGDTVIIEED